jgi:hypothetical protein
MLSESEVRKELISYLKSSVSLAEFENWLVSKSWNMHLDSDAAAIDLVSDIEMSLSEYSSSQLTLKQLRQRLSQLMSQVIRADLSPTPAATPFSLRVRTANSAGPPHSVVAPA